MTTTKDLLRKAAMCVSAVRLVPIGLAAVTSANRKLIISDQDRWATLHHRNAPRTAWQRLALFVELMTFLPEYRNVITLRLGLRGRILSVFCPLLQNLSLTCDHVGRAFCIRHGNGSFISAESIGENCIIHQLVTVGYSANDSRPTIGNNVTIYPGATVVGSVRLGDNCIVAANSLVIADVPPNTTVLGVPARVVSWGSQSAEPPAAAKVVSLAAE